MSDSILRRKGQGRMLEVVLAVVFFTALIIFLIFFFSANQRQSYAKQFEQSKNLQASALAQVILNMPEIRCEVQNCIDIYKFLAFKEGVGSRKIFYSPAFGAYYTRKYAYNITLQVIYPEKGTYTIQSGQGNSSTLFEFPVNVYNATSERYSFAMLSVRVYQ